MNPPHHAPTHAGSLGVKFNWFVSKLKQKLQKKYYTVVRDNNCKLLESFLHGNVQSSISPYMKLRFRCYNYICGLFVLQKVQLDFKHDISYHKRPTEYYDILSVFFQKVKSFNICFSSKFCYSGR